MSFNCKSIRFHNELVKDEVVTNGLHSQTPDDSGQRIALFVDRAIGNRFTKPIASGWSAILPFDESSPLPNSFRLGRNTPATLFFPSQAQFAINMTHRVFMALISKYESIFPQKKEPWYEANEEDVRKGSAI